MILAIEPKLLDNFKLKDFPTYFDNDDWEEFMQEVTVEEFNNLIEFYDQNTISGAIKQWSNDMTRAVNTLDF